MSENEKFCLFAFNLIGEGNTVNGDLITYHNIRVNGEVNGSVRTNGKIIIGKKGKIVGNVTCATITIEGYVKGDITSDDLINLKSSGIVSGNMNCKKLYLQPGATYTGYCNANENSCAK